ncbi:hypothetical protein [Microbacterium enclense]|uniref:WxL domain-containing protein n=1 Tax=Microbacterium enclense TaxID=993073 RepID=A0A1G6GMJ9_9MICO|nr:hypothetical protein [Microbacterium enclense]KSU56362.1 hypothetical protein AS029_00985 [Microbacterium enclense]SDB83187.1 hypothetical protein SAMN05216418_0436 [Microbacterium enclense]
MNKSYGLRVATAALGVAIVTAAGSAVASAAAAEGADVDITVDVQPIEVPGVLALSVAGDSATLTEDGSTDLVRQFTGTLPTVTVTDTRDAAQIPDGAFWSVVGSASDFTSSDEGTTPLPAEHLGWTPELLAGEGESFVSVGNTVGTAMEDQPGLVDQELLFLGESAEAAEAGGVWSADAQLFLRVPTTVAPGSYASLLTLSLFE